MLTDWLQEFDFDLWKRHPNGGNLSGNVFRHMTTSGQEQRQDAEVELAVSCSFLGYIRKRGMCKLHVCNAHFVRALTLCQARGQFFEGKSPATVCAPVCKYHQT